MKVKPMPTTPKIWRIYLDNCCLNRPFDDQMQDRIRLETQAVVLILEHLCAGRWQWIASEVSTFEAVQNPDLRQSLRIESLLNSAHEVVSVETAEIARGKFLESSGIKPFDALHLACAEGGNADVFLTTDDRLLRKGRSIAHQLNVRVENPLIWLQEVISDESPNDDTASDL